MSETSKLKKYLMWYKVKELFSEGLNKSQISHTLGLHRQTVLPFGIDLQHYLYNK